jgi:FkbM family methyltransferase
MRLKSLCAFISQVRPVRGHLYLLSAVAHASLFSVRRGRVANPAGFLRGEVVVRKDGLLYLLNSQTSFGYYLMLDSLEPETYQRMRLIRGHTFVDVGANAGGYTLRLARNFGRVIAIEPDPLLVSIVQRNAILNQIENIEILPVAVSAVAGRGRLFKHGEFGQLSSLSLPSSVFIDVKTRTLDEVTSKIDKVDLLKVDAEGAELAILSTGHSTLSKCTAAVIEVGPSTIKPIQTLLLTYGFSVTLLDAKYTTGRKLITGNLFASRGPTHEDSSYAPQEGQERRLEIRLAVARVLRRLRPLRALVSAAGRFDQGGGAKDGPGALRRRPSSYFPTGQ